MSTWLGEHNAAVYLEHVTTNAWDMAAIGEEALGYTILLEGLVEARTTENITPAAEERWALAIARYAEAFYLHP